MSAVHVVVPDGSTTRGGRAAATPTTDGSATACAAAGWAVSEHAGPGRLAACPTPRRAGTSRRSSAGRPTAPSCCSTGWSRSAAPECWCRQARRLRLVVLVHLPLGDGPPGAGARARGRSRPRRSSCTSGWTRRRCCGPPARPRTRVHVAAPGVDPAPPAPGSRDGGRLLCVAPSSRTRARTCWSPRWPRSPTCPGAASASGPSTATRRFVAGLRRQRRRGRPRRPARAPRPADRRRARPPPTPRPTCSCSPSRAETYGMVVTEALARGLPVLACDVGGVPEALGPHSDGTRPGVLSPPGTPPRWPAPCGPGSPTPTAGPAPAAAHGRRADLDGWDVTGRG